MSQTIGIQGPSAVDRVIEVQGVTKRFEGDPVLDDLTFDVSAGTILGLIGPSGAGKTTTVRLLTGTLTPETGTVRVLGEAPDTFRRATRERIGYMPQLFMLYPDLTARENVDFVASLYGMFWPRRRRRTREVLELVDLWDVRRRRASDLSGGMQRRLELACAIVHEPVLLFLDEPTAGLDPMLRVRVWEELHRLRAGGRTLVVTTQYVNEAESCDRVALIAQGRLIALAGPDDLRRDAVGGDRVLVETEGPFEQQVLSDLPFVSTVQRLGPTTASVIVDDAGTAVPSLVDALTAKGIAVVSTREDQPSFDDVFTTLVERAEAGNTGEAAQTRSASL